ncbi:hypothetical protein RKD20_006243 [Streptomyces sp. SLBN-8D4]|jgi:hypothetical protein
MFWLDRDVPVRGSGCRPAAVGELVTVKMLLFHPAAVIEPDRPVLSAPPARTVNPTARDRACPVPASCSFPSW